MSHPWEQLNENKSLWMRKSEDVSNVLLSVPDDWVQTGQRPSRTVTGGMQSPRPSC